MTGETLGTVPGVRLPGLRRTLALAAAVLVVAGCSGGPSKDEFIDEMTGKAAAGFTAEEFWSCVYDETDGSTRRELMELSFDEIGTTDEDLSRRVSAIMGECLGIDLSPTTTTTETTAPEGLGRLEPMTTEPAAG